MDKRSTNPTVSLQIVISKYRKSKQGEEALAINRTQFILKWNHL